MIRTPHVRRATRASTIIAALVCVAACAPTTVGTRTDAPRGPDLAALRDGGDCFGLREATLAWPPDEPSTELLYFRGVVDNQFNHPARSAELLRRYVETVAPSVPAAGASGHGATADSATLARHRDAYEVLADSYVRSQQYARAAAAYAELRRRFAHQATAEQDEDLANSERLWGALGDVPPQTVHHAGPSRVPITKDRAGLSTVPVRVGQAEETFVFDTGANVSVITRSLIDRLGLRLIDVPIQVDALAGGEAEARLAVAPTLQLGNTTLRNVVFLVFEDEALAFPQIDYQIRAILGFPVIQALGLITLQRSGALLIAPREGSPEVRAPNLCFQGLTAIVQGAVDGDSVHFSLDTGAQESMLYPALLQRLRARGWDAAPPRTERFGGAGGVQTVKTVRLDSLTLQIGGEVARLAEPRVLIEPLGEAMATRFGNIGQDVIGQFESMSMDFQAMTLRFHE